MIKRYFNIFAALIVATLFATSCQNERTLDLYEEGEMTVDVSFYVKDFDVVQLRSHLNPEDEHAIDDLAIWVFDSAGNLYGQGPFVWSSASELGFKAKGSLPTGNNGEAGKGIKFGGTESKGDLTNALKLKLKNSSDKLTVVALANFNSRNFGVEDATGTNYKTLEQFKKIKTLDELKALRLNINEGNHKYTSTERYESPLMYAVQEVTPADVKIGKVEIPLIPYIAKISATVKVGSNVSVNSLSVHFENIPSYADVFSAVNKNQLPTSELRLLSTETVSMYRVSDTHYESTGYLMPNYAKVDPATNNGELITKDAVKAAQQVKGSGTGYTAFDLRQKQTKEPLASGYVKNGEYQYAPKEATALVLHANLTDKDGGDKYANVTYKIILGDFSGVTDWNNPSIDDLVKINNYMLESATHYKYNITINGVNNIIVEAESPDKLVEPNPSAEGLVLNTNLSYQLDAHYEQRTVLLSSSVFGIFKDGSLKLNDDDPTKPAKMTFFIQTPFNKEPRLVSYTKAEAENVLIHGPKGDKKVDNDWIRIYVHNKFDQPNQQFLTSRMPEVIYSKNVQSVPYGTNVAKFWGKVLTVEQFIGWMMTAPEKVFDASNNICLTFFFDEYYYDKDPNLGDNAPKDPELWKQFANAPDRKFALLIEDVSKSADQNSIYLDKVYCSFSQHSIKTFFSDSPKGIRVWGVESIDENPNIPYHWLATTDASRWINRSVANGWINTWNLLGQSQVVMDNATGIGGYALHSKRKNKFRMVSPNAIGIGELTYLKEPDDNIWAYNTRGLANGVDFCADSHFSTVLYPGPGWGVYTPFLRNRDTNMDGYMQANELKWYIPSQFEAVMLMIYDYTLPGYAQLDAPIDATFKNTLVLNTSSAYLGTHDVYSSNPTALLPEFMSGLRLSDVLNTYVGGLTKGKRVQLRNTTRLIRDLGIIEYSSKERPDGYSYNFDDDKFFAEVNKFMYFVPNSTDPNDTEDLGGVFIGYDHLSPDVRRKSYVTYELPRHSENDAASRVYYKGFRLSKDYVRDFIHLDGKTKNDFVKYDELQTMLTLGLSPCLQYHEPTDPAGVIWRLPNAAEINIMALTVPDKARYFYNNRKTADSWITVWARTQMSYAPIGTNAGGYGLRVDDNIIWPVSFETPRYGKDEKKFAGRLRCVRDLTEEEWSQYRTRNL